jgi:lipoyl(octanoyl) transferase
LERLADFPTFQLSIDSQGRSGAENMAIDVELLERADRTGEAFVRFYRFDPPCLSLGRNQAAGAYDRAAVARLGVDVVRRPTGGRAVWHEHELTYAVAAPIATFGSLRAAYHAIHERLAMALRSLGTDATLASYRPTARPPDRPFPCFTAAVGGEVIIGGRKIVGSAQVRRGGAFLQHGSILLDGRQVAGAATTLSAELGRRITWHEVADAVVSAWGDECTPTVLYRPLPSSTALFLDPAWTWRR